MKTDVKLKYQIILDDFLKMRGWTDEYEVDTEAESVTLHTKLNISEGHSGNLIIEASDKNDLVDVYIYFGITCKDAKQDELVKLFNSIHQRWHYGHFMVFPDGHIRWSHRVDFEGSHPTGASLNRIVSPGWGAAEEFADVISAVALTKQTASDAIREYDETKSEEE